MLPACPRHSATEEHAFGIAKAKRVPGGLPDVSGASHGTGNSKLRPTMALAAVPSA